MATSPILPKVEPRFCRCDLGCEGTAIRQENCVPARLDRGHEDLDAKFVPPPADRVKECLEDLVRVLQYTPAEEHFFEVPLVMRMAIVHAQFETIHPFIDGNDRVGCILLPLMIAAEWYPPVYLAGFMKANQDTYYQTLGAVQLQGEWTEWVRFVATGVEVACRESMQTAQELTLFWPCGRNG